jgi:predicted nucleic acid-binding Zn ribbon protein
MSVESRDVRHCIKCGREIGPDESICEVCNRAGMATPSASQYHGTVVVAIVLAVAGLALAASLSLRGVGPYAASVTGVGPTRPAGYAVTFTVSNHGTRPGRAKCQLIAFGSTGERLATKSVVTEPVAGGGDIRVTERVPGLDVEPADVTAECS